MVEPVALKEGGASRAVSPNVVRKIDPTAEPQGSGVKDARTSGRMTERGALKAGGVSREVSPNVARMIDPTAVLQGPATRERMRSARNSGRAGRPTMESLSDQSTNRLKAEEDSGSPVRAGSQEDHLARVSFPAKGSRRKDPLDLVTKPANSDQQPHRNLFAVSPTIAKSGRKEKGRLSRQRSINKGPRRPARSR
jgi:hypothetical protein